jgi:hypothetical protein
MGYQSDDIAACECPFFSVFRGSPASVHSWRRRAADSMKQKGAVSGDCAKQKAEPNTFTE